MFENFFRAGDSGTAIRRSILATLVIGYVAVVAARLVNSYVFPEVEAAYGSLFSLFTFLITIGIAGPILSLFFRMTLRMNLMNEKLAEAANRDNLTGLLNRNAFRASIRARMNGPQSKNTRHDSLLLIDIDHFKAVNDTYGHAAGDQVLRMIGHCISGNAFDRDFVARLGGEEFGVYLTDCGPTGAVAAAERIRTAIQDCNAHHEGRSIRVTGSIGTALMPPGLSYESAFKLADFALYRAKANGRNRCEYNGLPTRSPDRQGDRGLDYTAA